MIAAYEVPAALVIVDEGQLFDPWIVAVVERLVNGGHDLVVAGLDLDYRGEPFGPMPALIARADRHTHLYAVCSFCGSDFATRTLRYGGGDGQVVIGGAEMYAPACRPCWVDRSRAMHAQLARGARYLWSDDVPPTSPA